jgi:hypothetical protein
MDMFQDQTNYESYLLRLWQVRQGGKRVWRASLENTRTGTRSNFADVNRAFDFLRVSLRGKPPRTLPRQKKSSLVTRVG